MSEPIVPPPPAGDAAAPPPPAALTRATALFDRGDFRGARLEVERVLATRSGAPPAIETPTDTEIEIAARALLDRMAPDRWAVRFGLLVLVLLSLVTGLYVR